jgi:hypothetical protein
MKINYARLIEHCIEDGVDGMQNMIDSADFLKEKIATSDEYKTLKGVQSADVPF